MMEREHGTFGRRTLTLCRWRWPLLIGKGDMESASFMCRQSYKVWLLDCLDCLDDKVVCPSYVPMILDTGFESLRMVVSGHGHMRSGLVVNQATTQRRWLVMASCYDSQGYIVRCGCVSASEEGMKYSD